MSTVKLKTDLLNGSIGKSLIRLSIPVILTSLVFIFYSLSDVKFISYYLGDNSVNSAAAATFFMGLANSIILIPKNGTQILVAQMIGAKNEKLIRRYARSGIQMAFVFGFIYMLICIFYTESLIRIIGIKNELYLNEAIIFLRYNAIGFLFLFLSSILSAITIADGDTIGPFLVNSTGIILNVILDYVFLGVLKTSIAGAAIATSLSIFVSFVLMIFYVRKTSPKYRNLKIFKINRFVVYKNILKLGIPSGISQILFSLISIKIATVISNIDESVLGVQRLGIQFEAFSWNIAAGVSTALSTFVAQNYGAKQYDRLIVGYRKSTFSIFIFGIFISIVFISFGKNLYGLFLKDERLIYEGFKYISIIGLSQSFQSADTLITGTFNGIGKMKEPLVIGVIFKFLRIPLVIFIAPIYGLQGIWWVISINTIAQSIVMFFVFNYTFKKVWNKYNEKSV